MAPVQDSKTQYSVLTLISSTQAIRLVSKQARFKTAISATHFVFSDHVSETLFNRKYSFSTKNNPGSVIGDHYTGAFYLEFFPGLSGNVRLVMRLIGKDSRQLLADADLNPLSPALPGIYQASGRIDWNGQELLFPTACSVAFWQVGTDEQAAIRFGCSESNSKLRYGFVQSQLNSYLFPKNLSENTTDLSFHPISDIFSLDDTEPYHGSIRFGRWMIPYQSGMAGLLGFDIDPDQ